MDVPIFVLCILGFLIASIFALLFYAVYHMESLYRSQKKYTRNFLEKNK